MKNYQIALWDSDRANKFTGVQIHKEMPVPDGASKHNIVTAANHCQVHSPGEPPAQLQNLSWKTLILSRS